MKYFLLVYDRRSQHLEHREFALAERGAAMSARRSEQRRYQDVPDVEVVLLGAERFEDLAKTHARYFKTFAEMTAST